MPIVLYATDVPPILIVLEMMESTIASSTRLRAKLLEFAPAKLDILARMEKLACHAVLENTNPVQASKIWLEAAMEERTHALQLSLLLMGAKVQILPWMGIDSGIYLTHSLD